MGKAKVISTEESEELFGISQQQVEEWEKAWLEGNPPGEFDWQISRGRPLKFGEEMRMVGFKLPVGMIERIDERAQQLGMNRSDYLRMLVDKDLATSEK